jgi:hypothetical protein
MANSLYGPGYVNSQRSSGYKSTIYSMAEIVDNSVDANASKIDIIFIENEKNIGQRTSIYIEKIIFVDNGKGMTEDRINGCLMFAEGEGKNDQRIGAFGVGLPNSSISVGKRVDVYSRTDNSEWKFTFLDLDDQKTRLKPETDDAISKNPNFEELNLNSELINEAKTIIVWSKLDKLDATKAETLISRGDKLLGRIYRYKLNNNLNINFKIFRKGNTTPELEKCLLSYDPLFLTTSKNYITDLIWKSATQDDPYGKHNLLGDTYEVFNSKYHFKQFIENCIENSTSLPLFQKLDDYWDLEKKITLNGKTYKWSIKAAFACKSIRNPGVRNGGSTWIGKELGKKMSGDSHFKSGNIFFLRAGREIDFGNFGLYTVTEEKNRYWTIEIHFDSDLDELMGISNTKQSVDFKYVTSSDIAAYDINEELPVGIEKDFLREQISQTILRAINLMSNQLREYTRQWIQEEDRYLKISSEGDLPLPTPEDPIRPIFPTGGEWNKKEVDKIVDFLHGRFLEIPVDEIRNQVIKEAERKTKTIVLYAPNQTGSLFELNEIEGKFITFINTNHLYYQNIIYPLKSNPDLRIFTISIEMLISALALEMDNLILNGSEEYKDALEDLLQNISTTLNRFIRDRKITIPADDFINKNSEDSEDSDESKE